MKTCWKLVRAKERTKTFSRAVSVSISGRIGSEGGEKSYRMAIAYPATGFCRCNRAERARCTRLCPRGCRLAVSWESWRVCTIVLEAVTLPWIAALVNRGPRFAAPLPTRLYPLRLHPSWIDSSTIDSSKPATRRTGA